ncbi:uncharacterized protein LOC120897411 [Anopheles arabiensis]|uniref:uncharacterized protein LOC120897411 n=1 Tax=Anopheles arabiensis TaxID=7173 RepID=UPI001AAD9D70|nr:uncharacterized protein LOC120897411 [Anopheles arabiensis]
MSRLKAWIWSVQIITISLMLQEAVGQTTPAPVKRAHRLIIMDYEKIGATAAPQQSAPLRVQATTRRPGATQVQIPGVQAKSGGTVAYSAGFGAASVVPECTNCTSVDDAFAPLDYDYANLTWLANVSYPEYTALELATGKDIYC